MSDTRIILASSSPRRKDLLAELGIAFEVIPSGVDETVEEGSPPEEVVRTLALRKAMHIAQQTPNAIIIGADSMVVLDGKLIGKPKDQTDAIATLKLLNGKTHLVLTGIAVVGTQNSLTEPDIKSLTVQSKVTMKLHHEQTVLDYVATGEPMDKAGSYSRSGIGRMLIESIEGSPENVSGLPLKELREMLKEFQVEFRT